MNNTINIEEAIETTKKQNKRIEELVLENEKLKQRIKEALEYINEYAYFDEPRELWGLVDADEVLKILKGEDNESN